MNILHSFQNRKYKNIFIISSIVAALIATAIRTVGLLFFYEKETSYFEKGSALPTILFVFIIAALAVFLIASVFTVDSKKEISSPSKIAKYFAVAPAVAMFVFIMMKWESFSLLYEAYANKDSGVQMTFIYSFALLVSAIFSVLFFLSLAFSKTNSKIVLFSSIAFFAWGIFDWITSYIEFMTPINSPDKILFHLGCIGAIIFMVSELRVIHGFAKPKFYYFSLASAIMLLSVSSIPGIIGMFAGSFQHDLLFAGNIVLFSLLVFVTARALTLVANKEEVAIEDKEDTSIEQTKDTAKVQNDDQE